MREIKFRAWDKDNSIITYNLPAIFYEMMLYAENSSCDRGRYEFLQYTGLKDKNGKEIYEGDRLYYAGLSGTVVYDGNTCSFRVKSDGTQTVKFQPLTKMVRQQLKIIGNIYEGD